MKHTFKKLSGSKIEVEVSLEQKEFLPYYQAAYDAALKGVHLKGFRPGTAPKEMAEAAVDKEAVFNEAGRNAVRVSLDEITKDREWTLIDTPSVQIEDSKDLGIMYKATLTVFPEVKLGNYKKIAKKVMAEEKEPKVEPKEIDDTIEWIRKERKPRRTDSINNKEVGAPTLRSEQSEVLPEVTDEWAKTLGKFENVEQLKKSISEGIAAEKKVREHDRLRLKMLDEIVKEAAIELPEVMVQKTYDNMLKQYSPMLKAGGKSEEEIQKMIHEKAKNNVESNLVMYQLAKVEKLEPTEEEVKKQQGSVETDANYQYIYGVLQNEKVFQFLEKQK